jgi:superfamily II DNA or RNA helicase
LPGWKISQAGGGKKDFDGGDLVVATMATLHRNVVPLVKSGWFQGFTVLLVDEVHHAGTAKTWQTVIRLCPALFRFGASDSVKDKRKEDIVAGLAIRGLFGPVRATIDVTPLITTGRVARPSLYLVDVAEWAGQYDHLPHQPKPGTPAWCLLDGVWHKGVYKGGAVDETVVDELGQPLELTGWQTLDLPDRGEIDVESRWCLLDRAYDLGVIRHKPRNALIKEWAQHFAQKKGWPTLIVATRTLHVLILEQMLRDVDLDVRTLTGADTTKTRDKTFEWLMDKPGRILISPLVKEGVSLPELRAGIVADVIASPDLARQVIGRFIRKKPTGDNTSSIVWFIDRQYRSARANCMKLFKELEQIRGYTYFWPCEGPAQVGLKYEAADFS